MKKSTRLLLALVLIGLLGLYPALAPVPHRIDEQHYKLIQTDMTREQVEAIFGIGPGVYDWAEPEPNTRMTHYSYVLVPRRKQHTLDKLVATKADYVYQRASALDPRAHGLLGWSRTWTSRHGSFTIWFDDLDLVVNRSSESVRVVQPWQRWWTAVWKAVWKK
jgi:hypothetical protein